MTEYLLDTGPLAAYLMGRSRIVALVSAWIRDSRAWTSVIAYGEVMEHLHGHSQFEVLNRRLNDVLVEVPPLPPTLPILARYAQLRRTLRPPYGPGLIGDLDTIIAATALVHGLTVVTTDSDFTRVPELDVLLLDRSELRSR